LNGDKLNLNQFKGLIEIKYWLKRPSSNNSRNPTAVEDRSQMFRDEKTMTPRQYEELVAQYLCA